MAQQVQDDVRAVTDEAVRHLQELIRLDTTNPPGNETAAAQYIAGVLRDEGYEPVVIESAPGRGNVVARYAGRGGSEPLLIYGHTDVVMFEPDRWQHGPCSGDIADGCIWGRGALDMKSMVAQELMVMLLLKRSGISLERDVIFAATADEEAGGHYGMGYLVDNRRDLIQAEFGISEGGGMTTYLAGRPYYDVRTAEKGACRFHLVARGQPGHGSIPRPETAVSRLSEAVTKLVKNSLPFRSTPTLRTFFPTMAAVLGVPAAQRELTEENLRRVSQMLPPTLAQYMHAVTHDTAVPTGLRAGSKINVIPGEAIAWVDGRYLPGQTAEGFLSEVRRIVGPELDIEPVEQSLPLEDEPRGPLYDTIVSVMKRYAPNAPVMPLMLSGATDAKHVSRMGTKCLGFGPVRVPDDFPAEQLIHAHDERIPIDGYVWGLGVLHEVVTGVCKS